MTLFWSVLAVMSELQPGAWIVFIVVMAYVSLYAFGLFFDWWAKREERLRAEARQQRKGRAA